VPPPPDEVPDCLSALEQWIHREDSLPPLVRAGLAHVQFETIHPFLDGNGRIGRLLIAALFEELGVLPEPLMYVSGFLKQHQSEYYRLLSGVRKEGDWESWILFFLEAVEVAATDAEKSIVQIANLVAAHRAKLLNSVQANTMAVRLLDLLPMMPRFTVERVRQSLQTSYPTANAAVKTLEALGLISETTGQKKNRSFSYAGYIEILSS
jgi:Fic family protein